MALQKKPSMHISSTIEWHDANEIPDEDIQHQSPYKFPFLVMVRNTRDEETSKEFGYPYHPQIKLGTYKHGYYRWVTHDNQHSQHPWVRVLKWAWLPADI